MILSQIKQHTNRRNERDWHHAGTTIAALGACRPSHGNHGKKNFVMREHVGSIPLSGCCLKPMATSKTPSGQTVAWRRFIV